ncbi:MAG TPA: HAD-IA family hydrolase [Candidatus Dependentiae bacterium]|nr:HAD-IA family hydrolase [Candidatus Dependentiae bacterium]
MNMVKRFIVIFMLLLNIQNMLYGIMGTQHTGMEKIMPKKTIIFDLEGVLFEEDKIAFAQKIGVGTLARYSLSSWSNPETVCLDTLQKISSQEANQPEVPLRHRDRIMPRCIVDWQLGNATAQHVRQQLKSQLDTLHKQNFFRNDQEKDIITQILDISINPDHLAEIAKPVPAMVNLLKHLHDHGYQLFILSNLAQEPYAVLHREFPHITALFQDIIISANIKMLKPDKKIFEHIINTYALNPQDCIFIDNQKENVVAAESLGIAGIIHKSPRATKNALAKLGIK